MEHPGSARLVRLSLGALALGLFGVLLWWTVIRWGGENAAAAPPRLALAGGKPLSIVVEVRNGTSRPGLARQVTRLLRERGVDVIFFGSGPPTDSTRILVRRGELAGGQELARMLGAGSVRLAPDSLLRVDLTVLLGADFRLPRGQLVP